MTVKSERRTARKQSAESSSAAALSWGSVAVAVGPRTTQRAGTQRAGRQTTQRACKLNANGETRLHVAARLNNVADVVRLLLEGADLNARDYAGRHLPTDFTDTRTALRLFSLFQFLLVFSYRYFLPFQFFCLRSLISPITVCLFLFLFFCFFTSMGKSSVISYRIVSLFTEQLLGKPAGNAGESDNYYLQGLFTVLISVKVKVK